MSANVVSLFSSPRRVRDWGQQEVAEFYRVRDILAKSGIALDAEQGMSDEGDPWFVFCRSDSGEVVVHFARIDDCYIIGIPALGDRVLRGLDFRSLIDSFLSGQTDVVVVPQSTDKVRRLVIHPNALMVAFVATVLLLTDGLKSSADAAEPIGGQSAASASKQLPFFDWAHYQRIVQRDGGWDSERTLAIVVAVVMASVVGNHFDLFDKANAALAAGQLMFLGSGNDQIVLDEHYQERGGSIVGVALQGSASEHSHHDVHSVDGLIDPLRAAVEAELARMITVDANAAVDLQATATRVGSDASHPAPVFVDQALHFIGSLTQMSPEAAGHVYQLALDLIVDLVGSVEKLPMQIAPEHLVALINEVVQMAGILDGATAHGGSGYTIDPGALVIEISGPSTIDTAAMFIPESSAPLHVEKTSNAVGPTLLTDDIGGSLSASIPVATAATPVFEVDGMAEVMSSLRSFLAVAQDVDVVVDNDTIVFVDRSDKEDGVPLQIGSIWTMQNDLTIMIVGSTDTIEAYHDNAPTA
jgi:hypothetical protein